jgi:CubicO group peptidase (beta-lactamase class C family)
MPILSRERKALGHVLVNGKWIQEFKRDPDAQSPAGGVSSSVNDLAKWMRLELADGKFDGRQIVDAKALSVTHSPQILTGFSPLNGLPTFYGLGWNVSYDTDGRLHLGHSGAFALGAATAILLVPAEHLGIVVLTNAYPIGIAESLAFTFTDLALYGKATQDWLALFKEVFSNPSAIGLSPGTDYSKPPVSATPALPNGAYVGNYTNELYGDIQIIERDDGLFIVEGPRELTLPLKHYDRDVFTCETEGENSNGATGVVFTVGADGKATALVVEDLDLQGQGMFKRRSAAQVH